MSVVYRVLLLFHYYFINSFKHIFDVLKRLQHIFRFFTEENSSGMDVTRQNFESVLDKVEKSIKEATFLTIDCELTGLNTIRNVNAFDTIEEYFHKVTDSCRDFLVVQYGITAFRYVEDENLFKQSSYNFYIFRRPLNRNIPDQRFLCQTSSIDFLVTQGFDFNKLFREGISYLNIEEEKKYIQNLQENIKEKIDTPAATCKKEKIAIPPTDQPFIDEVMKSISEYMEGTDEEPLQLPKCNPFCRRLIYQETEEVFGDKIFVETKQLENKDRILFVSHAKSIEELQSFAKQKYEDEMKIFDDCIGFTKILRMIVESSKLVVGHNLLLDLIHTVDKFLTPLSNGYQDFKECVHDLFPCILDTKFMSSNSCFKDLISSSVLGHMLETVQKEPFEIPTIEIEDGCSGYSLQDKKEHEAAFDAFITGVSFLAMWNYIGKEAKLSPQETFSSLEILEPYFNKIFVMRVQDNPYINITGSDPVLPRDHVFYVCFPAEWKTTDLQNLFSPFGNIYISWINESSAFVALYKRDQARSSYESLKKSGSSNIIIKTFKEYHQVKRTASSQSSTKKRKVNEEQTVEKVTIKKKKSPAPKKLFPENDNW